MSVPEPLWWSHPGYDHATGVECRGCGCEDAKYYDIDAANPLCHACWEELR